MNKSIKKNYIYNLMYQIIIIILPVIMTPYLSRTLGATGIGIYGYTTSIVTYFILIGTLGMNLYGQREIAFYQNDYKKRSKIFSELLFLRIVTLSITCLIFSILFCIEGKYSIYYRILLVELSSNIIDISWLFQGLEEFKKIVYRNLIIKILTIILVFIFVNDTKDLWVYILIYSFSNFFGNLILWHKLKNYVKISLIKFKDLIKHCKPMLLLFIPQIAIQVYAVLDKTMIGIIMNNMSEVGLYEQSQKIVRILMTVITSLGIVMLPRIANYYSKNKNNEVKKYIEKSFHLVFLLAFPLMFGIIAVSKNFVPLFLGKGYEKVIYLLSVMSLIIIPVGISNITGNAILIPQKKQKEYTVSVIVGAIINFLLNYILINVIGTLGAVISTVIAETIISIIQLHYSKNEISVSKLFKISKKYFFASIIMFVCSLVPLMIEINAIYIIIIQVLIGVISYIVMLYIFRDDFLNEIIYSILKVIKKGRN